MNPTPSRGLASPGEHEIIRMLHQVNRRIEIIERKLNRMGTAQEEVTAALAGDEAAINALGERVKAVQTGLEEQVSGLSKEIEELKGANPEINVAALEERLAGLKALADAIDAPSPPPPPVEPPVEPPAE